MIAKLLKDKRKSLLLTQEEMAKKIGVSRLTYVLWEEGKQAPSPKSAKLISKTLHISYRNIYEERL